MSDFGAVYVVTTTFLGARPKLTLAIVASEISSYEARKNFNRYRRGSAILFQLYCSRSVWRGSHFAPVRACLQCIHERPSGRARFVSHTNIMDRPRFSLLGSLAHCAPIHLHARHFSFAA